MIQKFFIITGLFFIINSQAAEVYEDQFHMISEVKLVEVVNGVEVNVEEAELPYIDNLKSAPIPAPGLPGVIMVTKDLLALGKEIYKIVEAGRPVVNVDSDPFDILPKSDKGLDITPFDLTNWKAPRARKYRINATNYMGIKAAVFEFIVIFSYGGKYNGRGHYITGAQIKPTKVNVKWGYNLDASFKVQTITNSGTKSEPIASSVISIDYIIKTVLQENRSSKLFYINGLGDLKAY